MANEDIQYTVSVDDSEVLKSLKNIERFAQNSAVAANRSFQNIEKGAKQSGKEIGKTAGKTAALTAELINLGKQAIRFLGQQIAESIELAEKQIQVEAQLATAIQSTGGAAGLTSRELTDLASSLQSVTNFGDEAIIEAESLLLTFTKIGGETFPRATKAILDVAVRMKTDLKSAALQVGKALNDPIKGLDGLSRSGIQFTEIQKEQIKTLAEAGDVAGAQALILGELETQFGGSAEAARDASSGFDSAGNAIGDLKEAIGIELLPSVREYNEAVIKAAEGWTSAIKDVGLLKDTIQEVTGITDVPREDVEGLNAALLLATDPVGALGIGFERIQKALEEIITPGANVLAQNIIESTVGLDEFAKGLEDVQKAADELATGPVLIDTDALEESNEELDKALDKLNDLERDASRKRIDIIRKAGQKAVDTEEDFIEKRLDNARDFLRKIEDIESKNAQAITDSATDLRRDEEDAYRDFNRGRAELERDSTKERIKIEEDYRDELRKIQQNFADSADEAARNRDAVTFFRLQRERDRAISEAKITRTKRVDESRTEASEKREELNRSLQQQLEDNRIADGRRLEDLQIRLEREYEAARIANERELQDTIIAEDRKRAELKLSLDRQLAEAELANERRLSDFKESLDKEVRAQVEAELKKTRILKEQIDKRIELDRQYQSTRNRFQQEGRTSRLGGRQHGGPVGAGQAVTVCERGPEIFQPSVAGNVIPLGPGITSPLAAQNISNTINNVTNASVNQSMLDPSQQSAMMRAIAANVASETVRRIISG